MNKVYKVIVIDDHAVVREGLSGMITQEKDMLLCGVDDGTSAVRMVNEFMPDIVILDLSLKSMNGMDLIASMKSCKPDILILVFSMHDELIFAERCIKTGASGYLMKSEEPEVILRAIRKILEGKIYLSEKMMEFFLHKAMNFKPQEEQDSVELLSEREFQVFHLTGSGMGTRQIADTLNLSVKTIETFKDNIKHKLNLKSASELNQYAVKWMLSHNIIS